MHRRKGRKVGFVLNRYLYCELDDIPYSVAGLVWKWFGNEDPPAGMQLDHKDRDRSNNRIENLRVLSRSDNCLNRGRRSDNTSGVAGIVINWDTRRGRRVARYVVKHRGKFVKSTTDFEKAKAIKASLLEKDPY